MKTTEVVNTDDILLTLCTAVSDIMTTASGIGINHSSMVQKINKTSLKPDIGCFVIFDGGFSGLVVINFTAEAALEIYQSYMTGMGMPANELAQQHTSDDVGNVMGELMNQILGDFTNRISKELQTTITQSQPKMLTINKQVTISIDANLDQPVLRRVSFLTEKGNVFYLELAMDQTEFIKLREFEPEGETDPDAILEQEKQKRGNQEAPKTNAADPDENQDLLDSLGL